MTIKERAMLFCTFSDLVKYYDRGRRAGGI